MQELLGEFHKDFLARSSKMKKYFLKTGKMKKFPHLEHYPLSTVLQLKNKIKSEEAEHFATFLQVTLIPEPEKRIQASTALQLSWLQRSIPSEYQM